MSAMKRAIERKVEQKKQDPVAIIHEALKVLDDPNLPMSFEDRMSYATPLLQVKHLVLGLKHGAAPAPNEGVSE